LGEDTNEAIYKKKINNVLLVNVKALDNEAQNASITHVLNYSVSFRAYREAFQLYRFIAHWSGLRLLPFVESEILPLIL
jgi:hypothetical protein